MKYKQMLAATALAVAAVSTFADTGGGALDLTSGNTMFGRNNAIGSFTDTYTFTLAGASFLTSGTASSSAVGDQDLDFSSIIITTAAAPGVALATFAGNLGNDTNEFFALSPFLLGPGSYNLIVRGINSATQASYSGTLTIAAAAVPEPETYAMLLAGLGAIGFVARRRKLD